VFRAIKITANRNYRRINRVITTPLMPRIGARAPRRAAPRRFGPTMANIVTALVIGAGTGAGAGAGAGGGKRERERLAGVIRALN